ncbi:MAG: hypothetical protein IIA67_02540 [Planctomycetes bacterium]|nr:hypothetical protein [Planctomycetota bacterium]
MAWSFVSLTSSELQKMGKNKMTFAATLDEGKMDVFRFDNPTDGILGIETSPVGVGTRIPLRDGRVRTTIHGDWLAEAAGQLSAIQNLGDGWDSRGGVRPRVQVVRSAASLLTSLFRAVDIPKPHINPTPSGGVQFDWEAGGRYFEIELIDPYVAHYYYQDRDAAEESEGTIYSGELLLELLEYLRRVDSQP